MKYLNYCCKKCEIEASKPFHMRHPAISWPVLVKQQALLRLLHLQLNPLKRGQVAGSHPQFFRVLMLPPDDGLMNRSKSLVIISTIESVFQTIGLKYLIRNKGSTFSRPHPPAATQEK
jgi:hypothetical protein